MNKIKNKKGFTLVELIVVIAILAILGTISFISLTSYSKNSRDSTRVTDMWLIKSSLELFHIDAWKYPEVTDWYDVTYSWWLVWEQWTFWEQTFKSVTRLNKIPTDQLTWKNYTYSRLNTKQEYEIAWLLEWDSISLLNNSYAWDKLISALVTWTYNWLNAKILTGTTTYVLSVPTIISSEDVTLEDIYNNNYFVKTSYANLPSNYSDSIYNHLWENWDLKLVNTGSVELFVWNLDDLIWDSATWLSNRALFVENLANAYSWTLTDWSVITNILSITNFAEANLSMIYLAGTIINNTLGWDIELDYENAGVSASWWWVGTLPQCIFDDIWAKFWIIWWNEYCEFG